MGIVKAAVIGLVVVVVASASAMQSLGDELEAEMNRQAAMEQSGENAGPPAGSEIKTPDQPKPASASADPASAKNLEDAGKMVGLLINLNGYLCARTLEVRQVNAELYGVHCITNRDGSGRSNYLINSRTNEVTPI